MTDHLETLPVRVDRIEEKLDRLAASVDERFEQVDRRFEQVDRRFEQVDRRFEQVDKRFDEVDKRFDEVSEAFAEQRRYTEFAFERLHTIISTDIDRLRVATLNEFQLVHQKLDRLLAPRQRRSSKPR